VWIAVLYLGQLNNDKNNDMFGLGVRVIAAVAQW